MAKIRHAQRQLVHKRTMSAAMIAVAALVSACGLPGKEDMKERNMALASGPTAMWYRFRFAALYRGQPFAFDQFVHCGSRTIPGGSFDSAPAVTNRAMYPRTIGRRMADGSYVIVRIPDMCQHYRAHDVQHVRQTGWASHGPFEVLPLVIWNDRRPQATVVEQYVARGYYTQPGARIIEPHGSVELMPVGFYPNDYRAVLDQPEWSATDPDENVDPVTGQRFSNAYASNSNGLLAFYTVPAADMAAALARFEDPPEKLARDLDVAAIEMSSTGAPNQVELYLRSTRKYLAVGEGQPVKLKLAPGPTSSQVSLYKDSRHYDDLPFKYDSTYFPPSAILGCISDLEDGIPVLSSIPIGEEYAEGVLNPNWRATALRKATASQTRRDALCKSLDRLVSYHVRDGRLDAAGAVPGAIVRRQWHLIGPPSTPTDLERAGASRRVFDDRRLFDYRFRFGTVDADLRLEEPRYILYDGANDRWLALFHDRGRIVSDHTTEGGW